MQQLKINRDFVSPFRYAGFGVGTPQQELSGVIFVDTGRFLLSVFSPRQGIRLCLQSLVCYTLLEVFSCSYSFASL